jgi:hypothetical protein
VLFGGNRVAETVGAAILVGAVSLLAIDRAGQPRGGRRKGKRR